MKTLPIAEYPPNMRLACPFLVEPNVLALVIKRTYRIEANGKCSPADEQDPIHDDAVPYEALEPPKVSPPRWDNDLFAFKSMTDIVIQGAAQTYGHTKTEVMVEVAFRDVARAIRVLGDRACACGPRGALTISPPKPFKTMPLRYDRAYGGQDPVALKKYGDPVEEVYDQVRPEHLLATTSPFHYPRNPAGTGYMIEPSPDAAAAAVLPNLEWPDHPVTPATMAVGSTDDWMKGPLPAAFDWFEQAWFPRIGYIGFTPPHKTPAGGVPDVVRNLAAPDLMEERSIVDGNIHPWFVQGATPGMWIDEAKPNEPFRLRNIFPEAPEKVVLLPGERPDAALLLPMRGQVSLKPRINTVVIQADRARVIVVWSCSARVPRPYREPEFKHILYDVQWKK